MANTFRCTLLTLLLTFSFAVSAQQNTAPDHTRLVDPFVGVDAGGNTVPGAAVPFGFVSFSPDTEFGDTNAYSSAGKIIGFSYTHVSGTGGGSKYGNFRVSPMVGEALVGNPLFAKSDEMAEPGYYAVTLAGDSGKVRSELAATRLVGVARFTFAEGSTGSLVLDASSHVGLSQKATDVKVRVIDSTHIEGSASFVGGWNPAPYTLYFYGEFNRPAKRFGTWKSRPGSSDLSETRLDVQSEQNTNYANRAGSFATFDMSKDRVVVLKVGVSFLSIGKARANIASEAPGWDFDSVRKQAGGEWQKLLAKIQVTGGTDSQQRIFYTALYRSGYMPHDLTGENAWWKSDEPRYEDFYTLWDTFRTLHPLLTIIEPERQRDMVRSLVDTYRHTGWLPDARIAGANGLTQGGSNGDVLIADAIVKGLPGIDYATAYEALVKDAEVQSEHPVAEGRELGDYKKLGYMSLDQNRSASRTLEYAYNDFCVAQVAQKLGKAQDAEKYRERSGNWANLWNPQKQCIHPRYADGRWLENFDCNHEYPDGLTEGWDVPFYEGSSAQYSTYVPHDVNGLAQKLGGDQGLVAWLDNLFDNKLYNATNEPDLLAPYLYIHAGRQDRSSERVRTLLGTYYKEGRTGLPGNDDAGTMSSWYVWSAIGLYPNAGQPFYYIGSPIFTNVRIDLGRGRSFLIEAVGSSAENKYVQTVELNGRRLDRAWLTHEELSAGGRLVLHMGSQPAHWDTGARPPSLSTLR